MDRKDEISPADMAAIAARAELRAAERERKRKERVLDAGHTANNNVSPPQSTEDISNLVSKALGSKNLDVKPAFVSKFEREKRKAEVISGTNGPSKTAQKKANRKARPINDKSDKKAKDNFGEENGVLDVVKQRAPGSFRPNNTQGDRSKMRERKGTNSSRSNRIVFKFKWDDTEDTFIDSDPLYHNQSVRSRSATHDELDETPALRGSKTGKGKVSRNMVSTHWTQKRLDDMTARDWRIVREDYDIFIKGNRIPNPARTWEEMRLSSAILENVKSAGYSKPTAIQMQAIPIGMQQRDIIGVAETGSGKTAAFALPLLDYLRRQSAKRLDCCAEDGPLAVILGPTRELVQQIGDESRKLSKNLSLKIVTVVGGNSIEQQYLEMQQGCHAVAATPGRLLDCLENRYVVFNQCCYLVLDEADRMIDMGFEPQVEAVLSSMSATQKADTECEVAAQEALASKGELNVRLTIMFSATMPPAVERLAAKYMRFPAIVRIGDKDSGKNKRIVQQVYLLQNENAKLLKLLQLLQETDPPIIVFVNSKRSCDMVAKQLFDAEWQATAMHSGKQQAQREANLEGFKSGYYDVLVATDVAGRGLDISDVAHVINFEMASNIEKYSHRIGRTGRAGKSGLASTILTEEDSDIFRDLLQYLKSTDAKIPSELANHPKSRTLGEIQG